MKKLQVKVGAHLSVAGGLDKAIDNAVKIGAQCLQIFGSNPRTWQVRFPDQDAVKDFKNKQKEQGWLPLYLHASYLPNIASNQASVRRKSIRNLAQHLLIAEQLGAKGLIFHLGSGTGDRVGRVASSIAEILKQTIGQSYLIMENSSGGGNKVGFTKEELVDIYQAVNSDRVKLCLDTAHAFEAGQDLFELLELKNVVALHVNDSKTEFGSHNDRHDNIGQGKIGLAFFKKLAKNTEARKLDWILEVPGFDGKGPDQKNIDILKKLL